jgi:hypothetical protein
MALKRGRFSATEDNFIRNNHETMTDKEIGQKLNRDETSVTNRRTRLGLSNSRSKPRLSKKNREAYVAQLDDTERKKFFEKEIVASSRYKSVQSSFNDEEKKYYVEKYVEFMMDPTIETMTAMEKDTLHNAILAEVQIQRYLEEEKMHKDLVKKMFQSGKISDPAKLPMFSRAREIKDCQEVIMKCQSSLMVERKQRLKDQSDQSVTFTNLIKELKDPRNRYRLGAEAAMLKVIAEKTYNARLGKNIVSGGGRSFDLSKNFRKGEVPELPDDFLPSVDEAKDGKSSTNDNKGQQGKA